MPPEVTDEIEDMDAGSSTAAEDVVSEQTEQVEQAAPAESSAATDETDVDTLSIVRDVVGAPKEEETAAASSAEGEEELGEGADEQTPSGEQSDDYADVPFNKHPRFQQLIRERNELRGPAQEWAKVTEFMDKTGLTPEEAANGMTIMSLAKLDPQEAWKQIEPWARKVAIAAGELLSDDLVARVKNGELTQAAAFEISRLQAGQKATQARRQFEDERGQRQQQTQSQQALTNAASRWEEDRKLKDPNFAAKAPLIMEKIRFLHSTGQRPNTPEGVEEQLKLVYADVNRTLGAKAAAATKQSVQRKPALRPVTGGQVAGTARPETPSGSRSTADVIRDTLAKSRRA